MSVGEKQSALVALAGASSQLDAWTARVLAASDDVGERHGLRDAAAWLAVAIRRRAMRMRQTLRLDDRAQAHRRSPHGRLHPP